MDRNLATCVPSVRVWSLAEIPRHLSADQVQKVLDGCDRTRRGGKRDFAILLLLARLGLRAGEVIALQLDNIDWDAGFITVRGKTRRESRMPLPQEVGEAIADYLYSSRPRCKARHVFIRLRAPHRPLTEVSAISAIATRALKNAGVAIGLMGRMFSGIVLPRRCSRTALRWAKSARSCATGAQIRLESMPRWTWHRFESWLCLGREVQDETPTRSD